MTQLVPLGDEALIAYFDREADAARFAQKVRDRNPTWLFDVVPAYVSVGVFFDPRQISLARAEEELRKLLPSGLRFSRTAKGPLIRIPCCYEIQLDLARVAQHTGLSEEEVIDRHTANEYTVYAIGFCPGFPYLGYLPDELRGVPRLDSPRLRVEPGSVGLTGNQTGVYPLPRPGGWNLIGRTPLILVDLADQFFPLKVGDRVRFERIEEGEYRRLEGERLSVGDGDS